MKIERFEDIKAWQKARELTQAVFKITSEPDFCKNYQLRDQIQSAAVSVMSNIAESFDSHSDAEFIRFLIYARRSASETQSHLYVALDVRYLNQKQFKEIYRKVTEVKNLVSGFIRYLRNHENKQSDD